MAKAVGAATGSSAGNQAWHNEKVDAYPLRCIKAVIQASHGSLQRMNI